MSDRRLQPGELFVHFRIKRLLGEGGMGAVYEAEHEFTKRRTALKVIHTHRSKTGDFSDRMVQEARALADLSHPNVVVLHDANVTEDGLVWMATEYLEGETLRDKRTRFHPLPVRDVLRYMIEAGDGVAAAHDRGIIHRDLKPENIFLTNQANVKVLDFGAAKVRDRGLVNSTDIVSAGGQRRVIGTPEYMSPEHLNGLPVDERTDVYALGTIGYELLYQNPVCNPDGSFPQWIEICRRQIMVEALPLSEVAPHLPLFLSPIFQRAMAKVSDARYPRVADFVADLRIALRKCDETLVSGDRAPFKRRWVGPGAYVAHGPTFSPPEHEPVDVPSQQVVVAAHLAAPRVAASSRVGEERSGSHGTAPLVPLGLPAAAGNAADASGRAGDMPRASSTPAFNATRDVASRASGTPVPHSSHTTQPATVHRAERTGEMRTRRRVIGAGVAALAIVVASLVVGVAALRGPAPGTSAELAADAGSAPEVDAGGTLLGADASDLVAQGDAGTDAASQVAQPGEDAGNASTGRAEGPAAGGNRAGARPVGPGKPAAPTRGPGGEALPFGAHK